MKKFLALVLALVMTMSLVTISAGAADFTDDSTINYDEAVDVVSAVGIVGGYADGSFNPAGTLTRGAAAKIICNMILGTTTADALAADAAPFVDVPADHVFAGYIAYCVKEGIISGYADGTFRPAGTLTGYAFMKMLLGALGYDASIEGYTGANWSIAVAKRALAIDLDNGLEGDFVGTKALTREEAALYTFNAMKAYEVSYGDKSTIKVGDIEISTSAEAEEDTTATFYQKYFKKLVETANQQYDAFGRPATEWKYNGKKVGTYASKADATYTTKVASGTIYADLGLSAGDTANVTVDGQSAADFAITKNDKTTKTGGNGMLTELFLMKNATGDITSIEMVQINTYIAQIDDVDTNDDDERIVKIGSLEYVTEEFAEDDWVLYTVDLGESPDVIKSMVKVEKQTGELTKKVGTSKFTIDGEVYEASAKEGLYDGTYSVTKDVDFWVDEYGYIIKIDAADSSVDVANMALVAEAAEFRSKGYAELVFSDATAKEVDTDKDYGAVGTALDTNGDGTGDADADGKIVSYEVNEDGDYELTYIATLTDSATVVKGNPTMGAVKTNNATQFVYIITDGSDVSYESYVGYKNAPSTDSAAALTYYVPADSSVAALVFVEITASQIATTAADITVIAYDADVAPTTESATKVYYEFNAVVNGEATTVKVATTAWNTIKTAGDFYSVEGITYNSKGVGTLGAEYTTSATNAISVAGETVTLGTTAYTYDEETLVVVIDDGAIEVIDVEDIQKDDLALSGGTKNPYKTIEYKLDNNGTPGNSADDHLVDVIILVKNP